MRWLGSLRTPTRHALLLVILALVLAVSGAAETGAGARGGAHWTGCPASGSGSPATGGPSPSPGQAGGLGVEPLPGNPRTGQPLSFGEVAVVKPGRAQVVERTAPGLRGHRGGVRIAADGSFRLSEDRCSGAELPGRRAGGCEIVIVLAPPGGGRWEALRSDEPTCTSTTYEHAAGPPQHGEGQRRHFTRVELQAAMALQLDHAGHRAHGVGIAAPDHLSDMTADREHRPPGS